MMKHQSASFMLGSIIALFLSANDLSAQYKIPAKLDWWYQSRFGMFIHFGSYSYLGHGEWAYFNENWTKANYQTQVSASFNPKYFNAGTIAQLAKKAGMRYIVITAKHHEGFCMWKTAVPGFKDVSGSKFYDLNDFTGFKSRDILMELKDSCEARNIKFCLYYSILDWSHSSQEVNHSNYYSTMASFSDKEQYIRDMKAQLRELVTRYHPAMLWFDGDWCTNLQNPTLSDWWNYNDGQDLYKYLLELDSKLIINERVKRGVGLGDFECPEQNVPDAPLGRPWETCQTMNGSWGFNASDNSYKSAKTLIRELVKVVSRDGNYLLNIGPRGDGTLTPQTISILDSIGLWMSKYGESIYGTTRSPFSNELDWGFFTRKNGKIFAHIFSWPANRILKIPINLNRISKIYLMNDPVTLLSYTADDGFSLIKLPATPPDPVNSVLVIDFADTLAAPNQYKN